MWDSRHACVVKASVLAVAVRHPEYPDVLFHVVVCRSKGRPPWERLANEPVHNAEEAWAVVFAYVRSFQIEMSWRYEKSELAFQSPRVWHWEERDKLLMIARLSSAFLLSLLDPGYEPLRRWLLRRYDPRTGRRLQRVRPRSLVCGAPSRACGSSILPPLRPWCPGCCGCG